jgi:hypothetical protein
MPTLVTIPAYAGGRGTPVHTNELRARQPGIGVVVVSDGLVDRIDDRACAAGVVVLELSLIRGIGASHRQPVRRDLCAPRRQGYPAEGDAVRVRLDAG